MKLYISDILIILLAVCITVFTAFNVYMAPKGKSQVLIQSQDSEWTFPIDAVETVVVKGIIGETTIKIDGSRAWVETSPCDNQTCVAMGYITRQGQWTACLPNNVLVIIKGEIDSEIDALSW